MVRTVSNDKIEENDTSMTKFHWKRHKKPSVDIYECPFGVDRQLEDQSRQLEYNRNPRYYENTKVDKLRSDSISKKAGTTRAVALKANVLNKIVREASGVYNYAIVAPPRTSHETIKHDPDPETNPLVRVYAKETTCKPIIVSFGHRPRSASRTFNPSTMKIRLRHGEVVPTGSPSKTGVGLPVAVLQKLLYAPKIANLEEIHAKSMSDSKLQSAGGGYSLESSEFTNADPYNLFSVASVVESESQAPVDLEASRATLAKDSWVSGFDNPTSRSDSMNISYARKINKKPKKLAPIAPFPTKPLGDRPSWDEAFHMTKIDPKEAYKLKADLNHVVLPLAERLRRYAPISGMSEEPGFFCVEKQEMDKLNVIGDQRLVKAAITRNSKPLKGQILYHDPLDHNLNKIKAERRKFESEQEAKWNARKYQEDLTTIPRINYHPTTELQKMKLSSLGNSKIDVSSPGDDDDDDHHEMNSNELTSSQWPSNLYDGLNDMEAGVKKAFKAAEKGNTSALHDYFIKSEIRVPLDLVNKHSNSLAYTTLMQKQKLSNRSKSFNSSQFNHTAPEKSSHRESLKKNKLLYEDHELLQHAELANNEIIDDEAGDDDDTGGWNPPIWGEFDRDTSAGSPGLEMEHDPSQSAIEPVRLYSADFARDADHLDSREATANQSRWQNVDVGPYQKYDGEFEDATLFDSTS